MRTEKIQTYNQLFFHIIKNYNKENFLNHIENETYKSFSVKEFELKVKYLVLALENIGIKRDDFVGIYIKPSAYWIIFDFALNLLGAISVPIFANISRSNLEHEIEDAELRYIFIDSIENIDAFKNMEKVITYNLNVCPSSCVSIDELFKLGEMIYNNSNINFEKYNDTKDINSLFSIIYTSGTTNKPKGVELTNKNIMSQIYDINEEFDYINDKDVALSILPLAHIYERTVMSFYLFRGVSIYFVDKIENSSKLLQEVRPTVMTVVPRLLEKIFTKIKNSIFEKPFLLRALALFIFKISCKNLLNKNSFTTKIFDKILYKKVRAIFGDRISTLVSGGAALEDDIYRFFLNCDINLYQGYGLSETSPVVATNTPTNNKVGTVGKKLKSVKVSLANDGELLVCGDLVMRGYKNQESLTKEIIDEQNWLHTGDIAEIDEDGYIIIKSRKKELYKTSTGKYVNAVMIESKLTKSRFIEFAVVIANNKKFASALLFIDKSSYNKDVDKKIDRYIKRLNETLNEWEQIKKYQIIENSLTIDSGEITPSFKIARAKVEKNYEDIINSFYEE